MPRQDGFLSPPPQRKSLFLDSARSTNKSPSKQADIDSSLTPGASPDAFGTTDTQGKHHLKRNLKIIKK